MSGEHDLIELRRIVESVAGPGSWPLEENDGVVVERSAGVIEAPTAADAMRLVRHLEAVVTDNSAMWRTWRTVVEAIERRIGEITQLTIEGVLVDFGDQPLS